MAAERFCARSSSGRSYLLWMARVESIFSKALLQGSLLSRGLRKTPVERAKNRKGRLFCLLR